MDGGKTSCPYLLVLWSSLPQMAFTGWAASLLLAHLSVGSTAQPEVMNKGGVPYSISNPPGSTKDWIGKPGHYSTNFNTNVKGPVEHFDVYGEVQTKYSQVYWTRNTPINLPPDLVKRFDGKVMAITGYEIDQVTHVGPQTGSTTKGGILGGFSCFPECNGTDKSVPIYHAYNHHYFGWLTGKDSELYDMEKPIHVPNPSYTGVRSLPNTHGFPTNIVFKENPGGEYRKSYHGYPSGYAQLLHSPTQWVVEPMQIDTHNRNYGINDEVGYQPWFLPKAQQNNMTMLHGGLSPLIECPCSNRISRKVVTSSTILTSGKCPASITSQLECTAAIQALAQVSTSSTINNASQPAGCIMVPDTTKTGEYQAVYNTAKSSQSCSTGQGPFTWDGPHNGTAIDCANGGQCLPSDPKFGCTGEFQGQCTWDSPEVALEQCSAYDECQGFFCSTVFGRTLLCFGRSTTVTRPSTVATDQTWTKVYKQAKTLQGEADLGGLVKMSISHNGNTAKIIMTGPDGVWYGVGFNAQAMKDAPYAIIVDGSGSVSERKLAEHSPGALLKPSVKVESSSVASGIRTVVLTRPVAGSDYSIPATPGVINIITAIGNTPTLAYHKARTGGRIILLPTSTSSCICAPKTSDYLSYMNQSTQEFEGYNCLDEPRSNMLKHGDGTGRNVPNAACHMMTYHGGLQCCKHQFFLTDVEQDWLIPNETDTYFLKWRYYFQEYVPATPTIPASHKHLHHWVFLIDANVNDYEEDNAHYGHSSIGKIEAHLTARKMGLEDVPSSFKGITSFVMTPHCHAPSCIREEFWNADTGEIICNVTARYGSPEYGSPGRVFNEADYIAIPPCIFGDQPGLQKPFTLTPDTKITAVKYFNNTYRHLGQMAQWTGLMVYDTDPYVFV